MKRKSISVKWGGAILLLLVLAGCGEAMVNRELDTKMAEEWAADLQTAFENGEARALVDAMDIDAFANAMLYDGDLDVQTQVSEFQAIQIIKASLDVAVETVSGEIISSLSYGGTYEKLRIYEKDGKKRVIFRLMSDGLNYHDFELAEFDGKAKATDTFVYSMGQDLSDVLRQNFITLGVFDGLFDNTRSTQDLERLDLIGQEMASGEFDSAYDTFHKLTYDLQQSRMGYQIRIQIASNLSDSVYLATMDEFRARFPKDASADLMAIDHYILKEEFPLALRSVERLDNAVGGDPLLDYYRATIYDLEGDREKAEGYITDYLNNGHRRYSEIDFYEVSFALQDGENERAVELIEDMMERHGLIEDDFYFNDYPEFLASKEYRDWKNGRLD